MGLNLGKVLGAIVGTVGKVAGVVASVVKIARPIMESMRLMVPQVDTALDWMEEGAAVVGEEADDFIDRNMEVVNALEVVSARGAVVMTELNGLCVAMRVASQEQTPNSITEAEAADFIARIGAIREGIAGMGPEVDAAMLVLDKAGNDG